MRRSHFDEFRPVCPLCARSGQQSLLTLGAVHRAEDEGAEIVDAILGCPRAGCSREYPVLDGIPLIVVDVRRLLSERAFELLLRDDLSPSLESLLGDAIGPDSWFDGLRQMLSTYGWDAYADLDPSEDPSSREKSGAAARCLERLEALAGEPRGEVARAFDVGCGAGRTAFALAQRHPSALVLGVDLHLGLLRLARDAARGRVSYPRRRIGVVYDRRTFDVRLDGAARVDFWACDALALPFADATADHALALNVLDTVPEPPALLRSLARVLRPGASLLLGTPFDWATRATPLEQWIGGHSQRGPDEGSAIGRFRTLLGGDVPLATLAEDPSFPWHTRVHERATMQYLAYLVALQRQS
ncbi:MAG TPA: class I SAM-dependent methyltransferase [Polyangiaceae bacterium]|nr:class I SAM-dependent methyltransferase [Polyangiaceae bacterium]